MPAGWTLKVEQTDPESTYYSVTKKTYTSADGTEITLPDAGVKIENDMTITITNVRDDIPATGMTSSDDRTLVYTLAGLGVLALAGGGYYVWKKKDEFVEG